MAKRSEGVVVSFSNESRVVLGLSLIRISIVVSVLCVLGVALVPALSYLIALSGIAYIAGHVACILGTGTVGTGQIKTALVMLVVGFVLALITIAFAAQRFRMGVTVTNLASSMLSLGSTVPLLLYLSTLSNYFEDLALGKHFRRLILVIGVLCVLALIPIAIVLVGNPNMDSGHLSAEMAMVSGLAVFAVGLMFVLSLSGSLAKLIQLGQTRAQKGSL